MINDRTIVQLYWNRNELAIPATAEKYGSYCTSIAKNILGSKEDAEECVNDTYLNAWNYMPPNKPSVLSVFLGKITRTISLNRYKHNKADKRGGGQLPVVLDELSECIPYSNDVEKEINYQELVRTIDDFLSTVSTNKRNIFVCRYWYTESISKIAAQQHMTEAAVGMILSRMRKKLQGYLSKRGF